MWSKRDAASCFDTLLCPEALRTWFGRPSIAMRDFLTLGESSLAELSSFCHFDVTEDGLQADLPLFPSSRVWPMGYSWSSAVAQDVSLGLLRCGGFSEDQVICVEEPVPTNQE